LKIQSYFISDHLNQLHHQLIRANIVISRHEMAHASPFQTWFNKIKKEYIYDYKKQKSLYIKNIGR
jgi:hypothetical protein